MRRRTLIALAAAGLAAAGCQSPEPPASSPPPARPAPSTKPALDPPSPPPERHALPLPLLEMRLRGSAPAGKMTQPGVAEPIGLQAVGLNLCQTGYVLQAYYREADGSFRATAPLPLPVLQESPYVHRDPGVPGQRLETDFEEASLRKLRGTLRIVDEETGADRLHLQIDTVPVGIASGPGLGPQGCFTTGSWRIKEDGSTFEGPTSAVWDNKSLYWVGLRLDEQHTIDFWVTLPPQHRQPGRMLRGDLERVDAEPRKFPFRVVFRTRAVDGTTTEVPATAGKLSAAFTRAHPEGPLRIEMRDLKVPQWSGPFAGQTLDLVRAETLVVTDLKGAQVPIPGTGEEAQK